MYDKVEALLSLVLSSICVVSQNSVAQCLAVAQAMQHHDEGASQSLFQSNSGKDAPSKLSRSGPDVLPPRPMSVSRKPSTSGVEEFDQDFDTVYSADDTASFGDTSFYRSQPGVVARRQSIDSGNESDSGAPFGAKSMVSQDYSIEMLAATAPVRRGGHDRRASEIAFSVGLEQPNLPGLTADELPAIAPARQQVSSFDGGALLPRTSRRALVRASLHMLVLSVASWLFRICCVFCNFVRTSVIIDSCCFFKVFVQQ